MAHTSRLQAMARRRWRDVYKRQDLTGSDDTFVTSYQTRTLVETDDDDKR